MRIDMEMRKNTKPWKSNMPTSQESSKNVQSDEMNILLNCLPMHGNSFSGREAVQEVKLDRSVMKEFSTSMRAQINYSCSELFVDFSANTDNTDL